MFTELSSLSPVESEEFNSIDFENILYLMNNGCLVDRILPCENLARLIAEIIDDVGSNCHDVTRKLIKTQPDLGIKHGYLMIGKAPVDFSSHSFWPYLIENKDSIWIIDNLIRIGNVSEVSQKCKDHSAMEIDQEHNHIAIKLYHHSVIMDRQGSYIECITDRYPLASDKNNEIGYVFLPHISGQLGYSFKAYSYTY